jgi:hypothetical protein
MVVLLIMILILRESLSKDHEHDQDQEHECRRMTVLSDRATFSHTGMRYLVKARVKPGQEEPLLQAIDNDTLGQGSIAGDEYQHDMKQARVDPAGVATWVETCFCDPPLEEERPYWKSISSCSR